MSGEVGRGEGFVSFRYGMARCGKDEQRHRYVLHGIGKVTKCMAKCCPAKVLQGNCNEQCSKGNALSSDAAAGYYEATTMRRGATAKRCFV